MPTSHDTLLLKFRTKDTRFGVTRRTVKALANESDITETQVIHIALAKLAKDILPAYQPDDGPLTARQVSTLRKDAKAHLPKGKVPHSEDLFG